MGSCGPSAKSPLGPSRVSCHSSVGRPCSRSVCPAVLLARALSPSLHVPAQRCQEGLLVPLMSSGWGAIGAVNTDRAPGMGWLRPRLEASGVDGSGLSRAVSGAAGGASGVGGWRGSLEADWGQRRGHPACLHPTRVSGLCCSPSARGRGRYGQETEPALPPQVFTPPQEQGWLGPGDTLSSSSSPPCSSRRTSGKASAVFWLLGSILALKEALFLADSVGLATLSPEAVCLLCGDAAAPGSMGLSGGVGRSWPPGPLTVNGFSKLGP